MAGIKRQADPHAYSSYEHQPTRAHTHQSSVKRSRPNGYVASPVRVERRPLSRQPSLFGHVKSLLSSIWPTSLLSGGTGSPGQIRRNSISRRPSSIRIPTSFPSQRHTSTLTHSITMNGRAGESSKPRSAARRPQEVIDLSREEDEEESEDPLLLTPDNAAEMHLRNQVTIASRLAPTPHASGSRPATSRIRRDGSEMTLAGTRAQSRRDWGRAGEDELARLRSKEVIEIIDDESDSDDDARRAAERRRQKKKGRKPIDAFKKELELAVDERERSTDLDRIRVLDIEIDSLRSEIGRRQQEERSQKPAILASTLGSPRPGARSDDSEMAYRQMLQRHTGKKDGFLVRQSDKTKVFDPATRKPAPVEYIRPGDIEQIVKDAQKLRLEQEKEAERLTKPRIPETLSDAEKEVVNKTLRSPNFSPPTCYNESVEAKNMSRLKPAQWLSDDVICYYIGLVAMRNSQDDSLPSVHYFNSFFFKKLEDQGYKSIRRWTKKVDIFSKDLVLIPINVGNMHWIAAVINFKHKRLEYFDSMGDYGRTMQKVFNLLTTYVQEEHKDKKGSEYSMDGWQRKHNQAAPQQNNGSDCGVFSCQTLELAARGADPVDKGFEFSSVNMPFFRQLMIYEIASGKLKKRW